MEKYGETSNSITMLLKSVLIGVIVSLVAIMLFAFVLRFLPLGGDAIKLVNQFIKLFAVFFGVISGVRGEKGLIKGAIAGLLIVSLTYIIFGLISGTLEFSLGILYELAFGLIIGGLSGIISVNLKKA